ncbi:hypothetical protein G5I_05287 [Acromyrmex echinatior]|uniref:Uncharacterized protein n=1 Tax=Acromyrmex echinatior TaxID=103372 RepID=F4WI18_ACREC|nr:hypothetical protein G5I_05287 [Acromyrmex echinatior]
MNTRGRLDWLNSFGTNQRRMGARSLWISDQIRTLPPQVTTGIRNGARTQMAGMRIHAHGRAHFACVRANEATPHAVAEASNVADKCPLKPRIEAFLEPFCASERTKDEGTRTGEIGVKERCTAQAEGKTIDDSKPSRIYQSPTETSSSTCAVFVGCLTTVNGP